MNGKAATFDQKYLTTDLIFEPEFEKWFAFEKSYDIVF